MEIEILFIKFQKGTNNYCALGTTGDGVFYIQHTGKCWEEIPPKSEAAARKYFKKVCKF